MNNTLLIHMGRHKTGTTALQVFLHQNNKKLQEYGWCYPDLKREMPQLQMWRQGGDEKNGDFFYKEKELEIGGVRYKERGNLDILTENWDKIWEQVLKHLRKYNVILSEEALWYEADHFLTGAKQKYDNIKVIVYLRRQDTAMESWWNQMVKGGRCCCKTFQEYLETDGVIEVEKGFHYLKKLDQISAIIGKENLIVRVYEKQQLKGKLGIISDFFDVLGIEPKWDGWKENPALNTRLYGNYIEIKRIFNSIRAAGYPNIVQYMCYFERLSYIFSKNEEGYFDQEEREYFYSQFSLENEQIARKYLQRENGILFYDNKMNYPQYDIKESSSFEKDLIRIFLAMIYDQNEEIKYLKKQNNMFAWKLMLHNRKSRKILFFGAGQKCKELLSNINTPVELIVDNNKAKEGTKDYGEIEIVHPEKIKNWSEYFVIVTCVDSNEIEKQLQEAGLRKEEDYVLAREFFLF